MESQIIELLLGGETILNAVILVAVVNILNRLKNKLSLADKLESLAASEKVKLARLLLNTLADQGDTTTDEARDILSAADRLRSKAYLEPSDT